MQGVYVLTDQSFRPFARMSMAARTDAVAMAQAVGTAHLVLTLVQEANNAPVKYLYFPCGVIRGALANMGISTSVQAETSELPAATFQIKTIQSKP